MPGAFCWGMLDRWQRESQLQAEGCLHLFELQVLQDSRLIPRKAVRDWQCAKQFQRSRHSSAAFTS